LESETLNAGLDPQHPEGGKGMESSSHGHAQGWEEQRAELGRLQGEHRALDERLVALDAHAYLTQEEQIEKKRLQKEKLHLKDRILSLQRQLPA
jgi:hypothetical protein